MHRTRELVAGSVKRLAATVAVLWLVVIVHSSRAEVPTARALETRDRALRNQFEDAIASFVDAEFLVAERLFRQLYDAEELDSEDRPIMHFMVGRCLYGQGAYDHCLRHFDEFRALYPASDFLSAAALWTGHAYYRLGDQLSAARWYCRAMSMGHDPHRRIAVDNLQPLIQRGLTPLEIESLLDVLGEDSVFAQIRMAIAQRWEEGGRRTDALEQYRSVAKSAAGKVLAIEATERIEVLERSLANELTIGILAPLTGDFASYGLSVERAARLAATQSGTAIRIRTKDTRGDPIHAAWGADSLVAEGCDAVVGPLLTETIGATSAVLREHGIVQILPVVRRAAGEVTGLSPYLYSMSVAPDRQSSVLAETAHRKADMNRFCALIADTPEGRAAGSAFAGTVLANGGTIYPIQYYPLGTADFTPWLRRLKAVINEDREELLPKVDSDEEEELDVLERWRLPIDGFLIWSDPDDAVRAVAQIRAFGFECRLLGNASWGDANLRRTLSDDLDSAFFVSDEWINEDRASWQTFSRLYRERNGSAPDWLSARVYDAVMWLGTTRPTPADQDYLSTRFPGGEEFHGVSGDYRRTDDRQPDSVTVYRYEFARPIRWD